MKRQRPLPPHVKLYSKGAKRVFKGVRFDTYQWKQKEFDGSTAIYEIVKRGDTVIVLPIIESKIVLVKEQQPHWKRSGLTLMAGMVNSNEDLETAARRETEEESGMRFKHYRLVHIETTAPSVEWFAYTFVAFGYEGQGPKKLDPGERNEVVKISLGTLIEMARKRLLLYRPRFIEDMLMQNKIVELRNLIKNPAKYSKGLVY
jgi:ADP-ribose pyrophosphatase YjhB (NUDIX family)